MTKAGYGQYIPFIGTHRALLKCFVRCRRGSIGIKDLLCQDKGDGYDEEKDLVID